MSAAHFNITPEKRASHRQLLKRQLWVSPPIAKISEVDLAGKTVIVTGSNTGIGLEIARQLLDVGVSKLILAVRTASKGETAKENLLTDRRPSKQTIEVWSLDLESYDSIIALIERTKTLERLDIFVHNAGVQKMDMELHPTTGHEEVVQVNYLSLALLTILLLPVLQSKNTPLQPGRLVITGSDASSMAKFPEQNDNPLLPSFNDPTYFDPQDRYFTSKLLGQFFLTELAKRVPASVAIFNTASPGLCHGTELNRGSDGTMVGFIFGIIKRLLGRSAAVGARNITDAAVKHGMDSHGQYLEDGHIQPMAPIVYKAEGQRIASQLWQETMDDLAFAHVADIVKDLGH
ncbi:Short chain dehydrogenase [Lachnellula subtilissima]|uniref:Short chain dehydrogenase n=1 Tax=Lachnellula subtilissima TaxID=602034 RepID=A0A8H8RXR9_9HELO|nr:Short chain dehydrogenase [Lachnellula subtilissima]